MSTPILTKKQQRYSLSAKKGPVKGLRNILAQPSENYWPIVNIDKYSSLITLMNSSLALIKRATFKIPGSMLRHMSKEKRLSARKEALEKETVKPDKENLSSVILGINAVTRALEKNNVCCILLDANIEPRLLVRHIVIMAHNKKVPVLLLPVLKTITLQTIGFATAAFALKYNVMQSSNNAFYALYNLVLEVSKDFVPPQCSLQLFKPDEVSEDSAASEQEITDINHDSDPDMSKPEKSVTVLTDVYKYRTSRKERAFIPPTVNKNSQTLQTVSNEYISLSNDSDTTNYENFKINIPKNKRYVNVHEQEKSEHENTEEHKIELPGYNNAADLSGSKNNTSTKKRKNTDVTYLPLKVKRIQGDSNRKKATKVAKKKKKQ